MQDFFATWPQEGTVDLFEKIAELIIMTASRTLMGMRPHVYLPDSSQVIPPTIALRRTSDTYCHTVNMLGFVHSCHQPCAAHDRIRLMLTGREVREQLFSQVTSLFHDLDMGMLPISVLLPYLPIPAHNRRDRYCTPLASCMGTSTGAWQ